MIHLCRPLEITGKCAIVELVAAQTIATEQQKSTQFMSLSLTFLTSVLTHPLTFASNWSHQPC